MNFIPPPPETARGFDAVTTSVKRLSHRVLFVTSRISDIAQDAVRAFLQCILPQHGFQDAVIFDRDPKCTSFLLAAPYETL